MKKKLNKKNELNNFIKVITTLLILLTVFFLAKELIGSTNTITKISQATGIFGPIVLILLISLGILFTPIPSFILIITAGYLYGVWAGAFYSYLAHLIAAIGTFATTRFFEIDKKTEKYLKYKELIKSNKIILYLLYAFPVIPISVISIMTASLKIKWKEFLRIILISFAPVILLLSLFGDKINRNRLIEIDIVLIVLAILIIYIAKIIEKKQLFSNSKNKNLN